MDTNNPLELERALLYLYRNQTAEEQSVSVTIESNGKGFNSVDAGILSSFSQQVLDGKILSPKQLELARLLLPKYSKQLENGEWRNIELPPVKEYISKTDFAGTLKKEEDGLVFYPKIYPSKQIKDLGFTRWENKGWHQAAPDINAQTVQDILKMFGSTVIVDPEVYEALKTAKIELPSNIVEHETLFPFQKESIQFCLEHPHALLGLAPGLGKTACAIFAAGAANCKRILVISPLSLIYNWRKEIHKWAGEEAILWYKKQLPIESKWTITNYDTLRLHPVQFLEEWDCIIVDESIHIKNRKAIRTKSVKYLVTETKPRYLWLLSGAPVSKLYDDLWAQVNILKPHRFTSYWRFAERYCYIESNQWSAYNLIANRPDAAEMLKEDLQDLYFARTQDQVLNLPEWIFSDIPVRMSDKQDKLYEKMEQEFNITLENGDNLLAPNVLAQLTRLIQLASNPSLVGGVDESPKWDAAIEMLEYEAGPFILWTSFIQTAEKLEKRILEKGYTVAKLTGATSAEDRQSIVDEFQKGLLQVIIAHPGVGKFGLTLTAARTAIYVERGYSGDDYYQSLHRVRRIGTTYSPHIIHLQSIRADEKSGTVDNVIGKILESRKENVMNLTNSNLKKLFTEAHNGQI
jgi:SNF2 family DNA or RNA helicase